MRIDGHAATAPYPRPDFDRSGRWRSLDGRWEFIPDHARALTPTAARAFSATETIAVPGAWETAASGGRHDWLEQGWYRRALDVPSDWRGQRVILKVGAAFHEATVWLDDELVATHEGGYLPFEADLTDALDGRGVGTLLIRVTNPRDKRDIPHGKQRSIPVDDYNGCAFTPTSGIWQSVWIEPRPVTYLERIDLVPTAGLDAIDVTAWVGGPGAAGRRVSFMIDGLGVEVSTFSDADGVASAVLPISAPRLWSPADPHLYFVRVRLDGASDAAENHDGADEVITYSGLRSFEARDGVFWLNGERAYLRGVLDQGYWHWHGLASGGDEALALDLRLAADAGFNLVRKHLKTEDPRWLFHADRMGMLVWAEPASTGRYSPEGAARFDRELMGLIERDRNHPSIVIWGAYNEEWGLDWDIDRTPDHTAAAVRAYELARSLDPTRPVVENSGWSHVATDIVDWHYYNEDPGGFRDAINRMLGDGKPFAVWHSAAYPIPKSLVLDGVKIGDAPIMNSEYGGGWNSLDRAWHTRWQTQFLRLRHENQGYVYTELFDIEHETVGVYDSTRRAKDQDGFEQRWAHADTVICPLVTPLSYGADLIARDRVSMPIVVSHHGTATLNGRLRWWCEGAADGPAGETHITVAPFKLSAPVTIDLELRRGYESARLHLAVSVDGIDVARTFVDVREEMPENHLPADGGWRPGEEVGS